MATLETLILNVTSNVSGALSGLRAVDTAAGRMGASMSRVGSTLTRTVTTPLALAGGVAVKMALDYEEAFTKIAAISNTSGKQVEKWKTQVKGLAVETARAPQELAEALYFVSSSGIKASQVMDVLEMSAKAAASGLGETADVAQLVTSVLNAYSKEGVTAAQATDVLVAAVREGKAEPEEFAEAMGRILGPAQKAGVSFDQVAASMAAMSNIGMDVSEGTTAMRGLLLALIAPGDMASDALKKIGLSAQDMLDALQEQGLLGAMRLLEEQAQKFGKTEADVIGILREAVPNVRALAGMFGITAQEAEKMDGIFRAVEESAGSMGKAFETTAESDAFKMAQKLNDLRIAAINLGEKLIPIAQKIIGFISRAATAFSNLSPAMQENVVKWGLIAMAAGPVLRLFGSIFSIAGKLGGVLGFGGAAAAKGAAGGGLGAAAVASRGFLAILPPLIVGTKLHNEEMAKGEIAARKYADAIIQGEMSGWEALEALQQQRNELTIMTDEWIFGQKPVITWANSLRIVAEEIDGTLTVMRSLGVQLTDQERTWMDAQMAAKDFGPVLEMLRGKVADFWGVWDKGGPALAEAITLLDRHGVVLSSQKKALLASAISAGDFQRAVKILGGAIERLPKKVQTKIDLDIRKPQEAVGKTKDLLMTAQREAGATMQQIANLAKARAEPKITVNTGPANAAIVSIKSQLKSIPDETVYVNIVPRGKVHGGGYIFHGGGLASDEVPAILQRGEFVVRRSAVNRIGLPALHALNRMHEGGPAGHHGGGGDGIGRLVAELGRLERQLDRMAKDAEQRTKVEGELTKVQEQISRIWQRRVDQETKAFDQLQERVDELTGAISDFQEGVRDAILGFADVAQFSYEAFTQAQQDLITKLMGEKGLGQEAAISQLGLTAADPGKQLLDFMQTQLDQATAFSNLLLNLEAQGLDPALVQQFAEAGPEALDILRAIQMAGVENVNALQAQITAVANTLGQKLTEPLFGKQARELAEATEAFEKGFAAFRKEFRALPDDVQKEFRRSVGEITRGLGALAGMLSKIPGMPKIVAAARGFDGLVGSPTLFLAGEAGPERVRIGPNGASGSGGGGGAMSQGRAGGQVIQKSYHNHFHGPVYGVKEFDRRVQRANRQGVGERVIR